MAGTCNSIPLRTPQACREVERSVDSNEVMAQKPERMLHGVPFLFARRF